MTYSFQVNLTVTPKIEFLNPRTLKSKMEKIRKFLASAPAVSIGSVELNISSQSQLDQHQEGYSNDGAGRSLVTGEEGAWKEEWVVIGWDGLGDPIFVDLKSQELPVFTAMHGEGTWAPAKIADSLDDFSQILDKLRELSRARENPVCLEKKPISIEEAKDFLGFVRQNNRDSDMDFWEAIIQVC